MRLSLPLLFVLLLTACDARTPTPAADALLPDGGRYHGELLEGRLHELHGTRHLSYSLLVALEEGLEMSGAIVFIHALLGFLADQYHDVRLRITRGAAEHRADALTPRGLDRPRPAFRSAHR